MRGSRLIPLLVAFSLLFISVVHACSGQDLLMSTTSVSPSINESGMESRSMPQTEAGHLQVCSGSNAFS